MDTAINDLDPIKELEHLIEAARELAVEDVTCYEVHVLDGEGNPEERYEGGKLVKTRTNYAWASVDSWRYHCEHGHLELLKKLGRTEISFAEEEIAREEYLDKFLAVSLWI